MKPELQAKYLQFLSSKKNKEEGFTLIELLVVVIIIGVLAAVALPNLLGQVAKGRQAEAKNNLGSINRGQQAIRLEEQKFYPANVLPTQIAWQYFAYDKTYTGQTSSTTGYSTPGAGTVASNFSAGASLGNTNYMNYGVIALSDYADDVKDYTAAVWTNGQEFATVLCETATANSATMEAAYPAVLTSTSSVADLVCGDGSSETNK